MNFGAWNSHVRHISYLIALLLGARRRRLSKYLNWARQEMPAGWTSSGFSCSRLSQQAAVLSTRRFTVARLRVCTCARTQVYAGEHLMSVAVDACCVPPISRASLSRMPSADVDEALRGRVEMRKRNSQVAITVESLLANVNSARLYWRAAKEGNPVPTITRGSAPRPALLNA